MKISTKGRYGVRIMLDVAKNCGGQPVRIIDIAERQNLTVKYTEQITSSLVKCGLLRSVRGSQGGYLLVKPPEDYTVWEILQHMEGDLAPVDCVTQSAACSSSQTCVTRKLWSGLYEAERNYLVSVTLKDLENF